MNTIRTLQYKDKAYMARNARFLTVFMQIRDWKTRKLY